MTLISLLVWLVVFCFFVWAARALLGAFAIPEPLRTVVFVLVIALGLLALLQVVGVAWPAVPLRLR